MQLVAVQGSSSALWQAWECLEVMKQLSMQFYLTETPCSRISSPALRKSFSLLGVTLPSATTLRTPMLEGQITGSAWLGVRGR